MRQKPKYQPQKKAKNTQHFVVKITECSVNGLRTGKAESHRRDSDFIQAVIGKILSSRYSSAMDISVNDVGKKAAIYTHIISNRGLSASKGAPI